MTLRGLVGSAPSPPLDIAVFSSVGGGMEGMTVRGLVRLYLLTLF